MQTVSQRRTSRVTAAWCLAPVRFTVRFTFTRPTMLALLLATTAISMATYSAAIPPRPPTPEPPPPPPGNGDCEYENVTYPPGEFFPGRGPCYPCMCSGGIAQCPYIIYDCIIPCVDPEDSPDQCCPRCPNGPNCNAPNVGVIPAGLDVEIEPGVTCRCLESYGFFSPPPPALCTPPTATPTSEPTSTTVV